MTIFKVNEEMRTKQRTERRIEMVDIEMTKDEANLLRDILKTHLSELTFEIAFTHNKELTELLKKKREFMIDFLQRLEGVPALGKRSPEENEFFAES
jgi:hypothetical protein